jgi:hypothetical protein
MLNYILSAFKSILKNCTVIIIFHIPHRRTTCFFICLLEYVLFLRRTQKKNKILAVLGLNLCKYRTFCGAVCQLKHLSPLLVFLKSFHYVWF